MREGIHDALVHLALERDHQVGKIAHRLPAPFDEFGLVSARRMQNVDLALVAGEGEPLLLLHGLGGGAANWVELAAALAEERRVLVPDLPGHGGSAPLAGQPSMDDFAECAGRLAEYEGMVPAAVVGHSFGALVALRLALLRPDQVTSVVLAALPGISSAGRLRQVMLVVVGFIRPGRVATRFRSRIARTSLLRYPTFGYWLGWSGA